MNVKMDFSFLFSGLGGSGSTGGFGSSNFLADYASIKNGSYLKLMKAYYNRDKADSTTSADKTDKNSIKTNSTVKGSTSISADSATTLAAIEKDAEALKKSADTLWVGGSKSLFEEKDLTSKAEDGTEITTRGYDTEAIQKGVQSFVKSYNALIKSAGSAETASIAQRADSMKYAVQTNSRLLAKVGITVGTDNTLAVDSEKLGAADISTLKTLFQGENSLAYRMSSNASMIDYTAQREAEKANTYNARGSYNSNFSSGSLFADYF